MNSKKFINIDNYSMIHIGYSNQSVINVFIKTQLKLSDKFVTEPFGSNKMRFQYPEIFTYNIINSFNEDEYIIYELEIKRNKINCSRTSKFFWGEGWKLDLNISNFNKLSIYDLNYSKINEILPKKYGIVETKVTNVNKFKTGIVVPFYNRNEYVKKFLNSLNQTDVKDCLFVFLDESMTKNIDEDKKIVHNLVKGFDMEQLNIIKIYKNKHGNMFDSILRGLDVLSHFCDTLMTIDSDTIHKKDWINKCLSLLKTLSKNDKPVVISGFNTINTGKHSIKEEFKNYYLKNTVGGCHMCFTTHTYLNYIRCTLISHKWDTNLINNIIQNNGIIAVTKPSVIDHIGFKSSGHRNDNGCTYDHALDFA